MVNDLTGLSIGSLAFVNMDHVLSGNPITLTDTTFSLRNAYYYVVGNPSYTTVINCSLIFPNGGEISTPGAPGVYTESTQDLYVNAQITVNSGLLLFTARAQDLGAGGNGHLHIASVISGDANVWAHAEDADGHVSTISFDGDGNTFSGKLRLSTTG